MTEQDIRRWWRGLRVYQKQAILGVDSGDPQQLAWKYLSCEQMRQALLGYRRPLEVKNIRQRKERSRRKIQWSDESVVSVERMMRLAGAA